MASAPRVGMGTLAAASLAKRSTSSPPSGARPVSAIVPAASLLPIKDRGSIDSEARVTGGGVRVTTVERVMPFRVAEAFEISADEILGMKKARLGPRASRRVGRVEELPPQQQATLLRTIDTFLRAAGK